MPDKWKGYKWSNSSTGTRAPGARPPREDEVANSEYYQDKVALLLTLTNGDVPALADFLNELGDELGLKHWATRASATRALVRLAEGRALLDWGMELVDAAEEFLS